MKYEALGHLNNGPEVVYDPVGSHTATHFNDAPNLRELVQEILPQQTVTAEAAIFAVDMGRPIGVTDAVATDETDEIVYAKRLNRDIYTPFTRSRQPQPCSLVTLALKQLDPDRYELASAWIGEADSPPFPGDANETPQSRPYWSEHALVWGTQAIQPGSETTDCPW